MHIRCTDKKHDAYKRYGGRGIKVCKRWETFTAFLKDMGERPLGKTLDRKNNNGDYKPSNCRWSDSKTQARNKTDTVFVTISGKKACITEWAEITGLKSKTLFMRYFYGWRGRKLISPLKIVWGSGKRVR